MIVLDLSITSRMVFDRRMFDEWELAWNARTPEEVAAWDAACREVTRQQDERIMAELAAALYGTTRFVDREPLPQHAPRYDREGAGIYRIGTYGVGFSTPRGPRSWAYDVWMRGSLA